MTHRVKVRETRVLSRNWAKLTSVTIDYERRDGSWQTLEREIHDHGHAAAVLPINRRTGNVVLVRQFRLPAFLNGDESFMLEIIAGMLDGDTPEDCVRREAAEEAGLSISGLQRAFTVMPSPGALTEKVDIFVAGYTDAGRIGDGGGLHHEGEDIEVVELAFADALKMIETGGIIDAKTVMALQYAALHNLVQDTPGGAS